MLGWSLFTPVLDVVLGVAGAFFVGTLVEYWGHRLMHSKLVKGVIHENHHLLGIAQGVGPEFWVYVKGAVVFSPVGFLVSFWGGVGAVTGSLAFAFVAALSHQLSHERPSLLWWQPMPVHHIHHRYNEQTVNFGISTDLWDRVFRTYRPRPYEREQLPFVATLRTITWAMPADAQYWDDYVRETPAISAKAPELKAFRRALTARRHPDGGVKHLAAPQLAAVLAEAERLRTAPPPPVPVSIPAPPPAA